MKHLLPLALFLAALVTVWPAHVAGPAHADTPARARSDAALLEAAQRWGGVRVLVTLRLGAMPASSGREPSAAGADVRAQDIARAREALLGRLQPHDWGGVRTLTSAAALAMDLTPEGLEAVLAAPEVMKVEEDRLSEPLLGVSVPLIGATEVWPLGHTGSGQTVVLVDTGVDASHPFLAGGVVAEACFSTTTRWLGSSSLCPGGADSSEAPGSGAPCTGIEGCEHGTHVAGIAAGRGGPYPGVAPGATIIPIQVFSRFDRSDVCGGAAPCIMSYTSDQIAALEYVYDVLRARHTVAAVNMSLGGGAYASPCEESPLGAAIAGLRGVGVATVAASGNAGLSAALCEPACVPGAVSVGSTTSWGVQSVDQVSSFSNSAPFLGLLAPGEFVLSAVPGGSFAYAAGTSMAAPHVAGALAVLRSAYPAADVATLLEALASTGLAVQDARNGVVTPRIRVDAALAALAPKDAPLPVERETPEPVATLPPPEPAPAHAGPLHLPLIMCRAP